MIDIDGFDVRLLAALEEDGRLTNQELAEKVGLSASQCSRRRVRLESEGLIRRYRAELSAEKLGYSLLAFVDVTLATHSRDTAKRFRDLVKEMRAVQEAYSLTGDRDYLIKLIVPDLGTLAKIINTVLLPHESVQHLRTSVVLETVKDDHRLPLDDLLSEGGPAGHL
ncbi:MAG: AsnC family transcriptional regulator [Hyphomicrobiales bacterium]|nr:MAG: AsnC family transcriptional regulator [Hyphomicrobiales bacterium]